MSETKYMIAEQTALELIERMFSSWNKQDMESLMPLFTEDIELVSNKVMDLLPDANGKIKGRKVLHTYWSALMQLYPHFQFRLKRLIVEGRVIIVYYKTDDHQTHCISKLHLTFDGLIERMEVVYL
ncbi:MAG: nuclear transport factor 2 family protein [Bacteroidetes bacterium]|nr:nuclear transport factor 2 family protein [Bacteroidota bacterium]